MLNKQKHQSIMGKVLQDIYTDPEISPLLGFKGGTCAYFFYNLPRFSVDLDFDLLETSKETQDLIFKKIKNILENYGEIKNSYIKYHTIFFLLSYGKTDHNIKVEINTRLLTNNLKDYYQAKERLGVLMLVPKEDFMFACKLAALTTRRVPATRDIYDFWYFSKNNWDLNLSAFKLICGDDVDENLKKCIKIVENTKDNQILNGLGELLPDEKAKAWVKTNLRKESILFLKNYKSVFSTMER